MKQRLIGLVGFGLAALLAACGPTQTAAPTNTVAPAVTAVAATPSPTTRPAASPVASPRPASPVASPRPASPVASPRVASPVASPRPASPVASPPVAASPAVGTEQSGACEVGVPTGFRAFAGATEGFWTDGTAFLVLAPVPTEGLDFAAFTQAIPQRLAADPSVRGFQEVRVQAQPDRYRLDFTLDANPENPLFATPSAGTLAAVPGPTGQVCLAQLFYPRGQEAKYGPLADSMAASLRATRR